MCGIAGVFHLNDRPEVKVLQKMTDAIAHRGPDGEGHWINDSLALGHRRLSIIDLSQAGSQPMFYDDKNLVIVFNGEIYNYLELKNDLISLGFRFISDTDTEVVLAAYKAYGESCLQKFDGMFAFALWDQKKQTLFCARDRFGEKPFFYFFSGDTFYFASEMKALWAAGVPKNIDEKMFSNYIKLGHCSHPTDPLRTFYKGIHNLKPGHSLIVDTKLNHVSKNYWDVYKNVKPLDRTQISFEEASNKVHELLKKSVEIRLRSDVTVGSSLSGGLDSSIIVSLVNQIKATSQIQNTFSARFKNFEKDEGKHIETVVNHLNQVKSHQVWPDLDEFSHDVDQIVYAQEEPFGTSSIYAQWKVMQKARSENTIVMLDGQGADELCAGYPRYYKYYLKQLFFTENNRYDQELLDYNELRKNIPSDQVASYKTEETLKMKLARIKNNILKGQQPFDENSLRRTLQYELQTSGMIELLRYADRNAMSNSVEVRLPFLSHYLVEFILSLPSSYLLSKGWTKYILRHSFQNDLPQSIAWRIDKVGYETPQDKWLGQKHILEEVKIAKKRNENNLSAVSKNDGNAWRHWLTNKMIS